VLVWKKEESMFGQDVSMPALLVLPVLSAYLLLVGVMVISFARENLRGAFQRLRKRKQIKR
jgi:hypothetical protein